MISERKASYSRHRMTPKNRSWGMSGQWPKTTVLQREILLNYFGTFLYKLHVACASKVILINIFSVNPKVQSQTAYLPQCTNEKIWAHLLTKHLSITVYHLPTKENKLPFTMSVCSEQTKVCLICFLFAANKRKLPLKVPFFVCSRVT
jgi:hypothetical protein